MENAEIMKFIGSGANFYCRQLGNASHMEFESCHLSRKGAHVPSSR
jgi:hypothetical protein